MRKFISLSLMLSAFLLAGCEGASATRESAEPLVKSETGQVLAARGVITRLLGKRANEFTLELIPQDNKRDVFEVEAKNGKVIVRGSTGVSICSGVNWYLKYACNAHFSWDSKQLDLPVKLPDYSIRKRTPYKYRYNFNYCTFSYSMSFWNWERWQEEIDWMALNGINMPLALTGQEVTWRNVYKKMGLTQKELDEFFAGSTYFAWGWMGNLDAWGGPLPATWYDKQEKLQKQILKSQRALGMKPVLPAFSGHVPAALKRLYPKTKIQRCKSWAGFPGTYVLNPLDPLFKEIGVKFLKEQARLFGTDHIYASDTFNENIPPRSTPKYLGQVSKAVCDSMVAADDKAIWVMQGWMFLYDKHFWTQPRVKGLLNAVPNERMIILDLFTSAKPVWNRTNSYYGKPWIWCMLNNFGGRQGMYGRMQTVGKGLPRDLKNPRAKNMIGIGITAEGIDTNPVMYDMMTEMTWRTEPVNLEKWVEKYVRRRYGKSVPAAQQAWKILTKTVYQYTTRRNNPQSAPYCHRPNVHKDGAFAHASLTYKPAELRKAFKLLLSASDELKDSAGYQHDLVDLGRQVMSDRLFELLLDVEKAWKARDAKAFKKATAVWQTALLDTDSLLATNRMFLMGRWVKYATDYGTTPAERKHYQWNAQDLLTLWGDRNSPLKDYARREYSGLISSFYHKRWGMFFDYMQNCLETKKLFNNREIQNQLKDFENQWMYKQHKFPAKATGNPVERAKYIYKKYVKPIE